jgi:hypothetical protein
MIVTLTPDIERALVEQARRQGTTPERLVLETLRRQFMHSTGAEYPPGVGETLADFLDGAIGVLHSGEHVPGGARMSEGAGDAFVAALIEKRRQGRL